MLTQVGVDGEALPCIRLACATSSDNLCDKGTSLISAQHYKLNAKQDVLDRTSVSAGNIQEATQSTSLGFSLVIQAQA